MSDKKNELFKYLIENSFDSPPTVRELCEALNIKSTSQVHKLLHELQDEGLVNIVKGKRRNISIQKSGSSVQVPLLGTVAAGIPILAQECIEDYVSFDSPHEDNSGLFALHVKGESMINAGIFDGDIIIVRQTPTAADGEIVVALIGDEATVKRFYRSGHSIELRAENPMFEPIISDEVTVLGKVIASIRYYI
ncbi:MAG: transcriptional repressor LexA [Oscillospiraceae bacterium]